MILSRKKKYLQIALNSTLSDARQIIDSLPDSDRILIEAGTPLIKRYGINVISQLRSFYAFKVRNMSISPYIVADLKIMDRGNTEVSMAAAEGASAVVVLGQAPIETINSVIDECQARKMDSMVDMMNIPYPIKILRQLKKQPDIVILHRGVDEEHFNKTKPIPYVQIAKIRSAYSMMIALAGGDTIREVQRAIFNDANIVFVWKEFYTMNKNVSSVAQEFLRVIK